MNRSDELVGTYVSDMLALEKMILETVERQWEDAKVKDYPLARQLIERTRTVLQGHVAELEAHGKLLNVQTAGMKERVTGMVGAVAGMLEKWRNHPVSKMLRDNYTALSLAAVSYTMLHTAGLALKSQLIAELAQRHLQNLTPLIVEISQLMPVVVVQELGEEEFTVDKSVALDAQRNTHQPWTREHLEEERMHSTP